MGTNIGPALEAVPKRPHNPESEPKRSGSKGWVWFLLLVVAAAGAYRYYPQLTQAPKGDKGIEKAPAKKGGQVVPVVAAMSHRSDLSIYLTGLGSVSAYNTVTIRSRIDGE